MTAIAIAGWSVACLLLGEVIFLLDGRKCDRATIACMSEQLERSEAREMRGEMEG
jgi:hypothetical protein